MMEKLLGKKWFSRDNLLLLVLLGVLLFVIALPVKKEDSGKGQVAFVVQFTEEIGSCVMMDF